MNYTLNPEVNATLTPSHMEILRYIAQGYTNDEIAKARHVEVCTVKTQIRQMLSRLGANDRAHLVALCYQKGLLTVDTHTSPADLMQLLKRTVQSAMSKGITSMQCFDILREAGYDSLILHQVFLSVAAESSQEKLCTS